MVTDDPVKAGVIGAAGVGTRVVASLVGGVLADRHNRVRMMLAGAAVGLVIALLFTWAATGALTFVALLGLNVAMAARNGLFGGATQAALKDIVPADALGRAQASNQGRDAVIALAGVLTFSQWNKSKRGPVAFSTSPTRPSRSRGQRSSSSSSTHSG